MTNWIEDIKRLAANDGSEVTRQWLERAEQDAPYSVLPLLLFLKHNGVKGNEDVLARLAIAFPDRRALALMLGEDAGLLTDFYPPEALPETPDTFTTIDRFLDNYGKTSPAEVEAIDRAIFNPQPDYADVLAAQEKQEGGVQLTGSDDQDELINQFIAEQMHLGEQAAQVPITAPVGEREKAEIADQEIDNPTKTDDSMLSESLAKMYIAQHKYSQALEIIERINLKYPEKSIYFADQIRFLTKLVLNETLNDKK
ncbi:MAG: hypothetical protein IJJ83_07700 [Muribaculaceae bacterium]|nr:hypothetical protein [Muribaculaceae bacterium]